MMEILEEVKAWLGGFSGFDGNPIQIDRLGAAPMDVGLFPKGLELLGTAEDVLGVRKAFLRSTFTLCWVCPVSGITDAARALALQSWVAEQSRAGLAPALGADTRWRAENGRLDGSKGPGTGVYTVQLTAEFTQILAGNQ